MNVAQHKTRSKIDSSVSVPEVHSVVTSDDWHLQLMRYLPKIRVIKDPIVLCHGLGSNWRAYDLDPSASVAQYLQKKGCEVWSLNLRGHPPSDSFSVFKKAKGGRVTWNFDDHLEKDLPLCLETILRTSGSSQVHAIGHSMGGILWLSWISQNTEQPFLKSLITIASTLDYSKTESDFHTIRKLSKVAGWIPVMPLRSFSVLFSPLLGHFSTPIENFLVYPPNTEPRILRKLLRLGLFDLSVPLLLQLETAFQEGGLRSSDGKRSYLQGLSQTRVPVLMLAGDKDRQCPPAALEATLNAFSKDHLHENHVLSETTGYGSSYGHYDLLIGKRAAQEVYPILWEWITRQSPSQGQR